MRNKHNGSLRHAKLTENQVLDIYRRAHAGHTYDSAKLIAEEFGVSFNTVLQIKYHKTWVYLTSGIRVKKRKY